MTAFSSCKNWVECVMINRESLVWVKYRPLYGVLHT